MKKLMILCSLFVLFTSTAWSDSGFIEGKIQGASYVFNHTIQVNGPDDPKIVMENDFVLQAKGNKAYFLINVPKSMKTKAVNKDVRVYGNVKDNDSIFVDHIDVKYGDKYVPLCNWEQKVKENEH